MFLYKEQKYFEIWHGIKPEINKEVIDFMIRIAVLGDIGSENPFLQNNSKFHYFVQMKLLRVCMAKADLYLLN